MDSGRRSHRPGRAAVAGSVAAGVALGVGELVAALVPAAASPVEAVGGAIIDLAPSWLKNLGVALFGTGDKLALVAGILLVAAAAGAVLGVLAVRWFPVGPVGFAVFGAVGLAATVADPQVRVLPSALVLVSAVGVGGLALRRLLDVHRPEAPDEEASAVTRRAFLRTAGLLGAAAASTGWLGRLARGRSRARAERMAVVLPPAAADVPAVPRGADLAAQVRGLSPLFTPNEDFYRIDTALRVPSIDPARWRLHVTGLVDRALDLGYDDILGMDLVERDVTLCCVSNEVGGDLVGNARWLGVPLQALLERAGVHLAATQVVGRSVDGWTAGFPTALVGDGRPALLAVGMNGEPLPQRHGFPARLVVGGLYGYVSATKWLTELELLPWEAFDAYWVPRGWSKEGPVKTQSRIDVPRHGAVLVAGGTVIAGVAWAQPRGVAAVEVQVDDGQWREAEVGDELSPHTWRQWHIDWEATAGRHVIRVRATDGEGRRQPSIRTPPAPSGATGWHEIRVTVEAGPPG